MCSGPQKAQEVAVALLTTVSFTSAEAGLWECLISQDLCASTLESAGRRAGREADRFSFSFSPVDQLPQLFPFLRDWQRKAAKDPKMWFLPCNNLAYANMTREAKNLPMKLFSKALRGFKAFPLLRLKVLWVSIWVLHFRRQM